jgi:hypothetical protein
MAGFQDVLGSLLKDPALAQLVRGSQGPGMIDQLLQQQEMPPQQMDPSAPQTAAPLTQGLGEAQAPMGVMPGDQPTIDMGDNPMGGGVAPPPRGPQGMFGIKGGARDILGGIGDALLMAYRGDEARYGPQREKEKAGEIYSKFADDPAGAIDAMAKAGHIEMAEKMTTSMYNSKKAAYESGVAAREQALKDRPEEYEIASKFSRMMTKDNYPTARDAYYQWFDKNNRPVPYDLPVEFDKELIDRGISAAIETKDAENLAFNQEKEKNNQAWRDSVMSDRTLNTQQRAERLSMDRDNIAFDNTTAGRNATTAERNATSTEIRTKKTGNGTGGKKPSTANANAPVVGKTKAINKKSTPIKDSFGNTVKPGGQMLLVAGGWKAI